MRCIYVLLCLLCTLLALCMRATAQTLSCADAVEYHNFALTTLGQCEEPSEQNTELCGLVGEYYSSNASTSNGVPSLGSEDQLYFVGNPAPNVGAWQNYLLQAVLTSVADAGELSYVTNEINNVYSYLSADNLTSEDYFGTWQSSWWNQADQNLAQAQDTTNGWDERGRMLAYWKASNYLFAGNWPCAFSDEAIARALTAVEAFNAGLSLNSQLTSKFFNVTFNNGTASAQLPGIFITPDASQALPLIIMTTGTDYPKEQVVLSFGLEPLARGYAILVYDGPGQGLVIKQPPYMPFYPAWELVLADILAHVDSNLGQYVKLDKVANLGVSLGGYLSGRACAGNSDQLAACIPNPPIYSMIPAYQPFAVGFAQGYYGAISYIAQTAPSLLPAGYAAVFDNYMQIFDALLLTCDAASGAPELVAEAFESMPGPIDPELIYLASGYGGIVSGNETVLYGGVWQAYRNVQAFSDYDIANITCPVIAMSGTEDNLLGGQEEEWFSMLSPDTQEQSMLITFDAASGGALHCQNGSPFIAAAKMFAALNPIMLANAQLAPMSTPTSSAG